MKTILIWPTLDSRGRKAPNLGLASLGACLEKFGHKVKIIDTSTDRYNFKKIKKEIKHFDPDIVGISVTTQFVYNAYKIADIVKSINPNCLTVLGGPHPTVLSRECLEECSSVDVIVRGEGEVTFIELLDKFEKNQDFFDVKGITFRSKGRIFNNIKN